MSFFFFRVLRYASVTLCVSDMWVKIILIEDLYH